MRMTEDNRHYHNRPPHPSHRRSNPGSFFKGLLWGTAIGTVLGVLFAPDKGEETRKKVKKTAKVYEEKGRETIEKAKIEFEEAKKKYENMRLAAEPYIEEAKEKYEEFKTNAEPYVEEAKDKYSVFKKEAEKGKGTVVETLENLSDDVEDTAKKIKKKYFRGVKKR